MTEIAMPVTGKITRDTGLELEFLELSAKMGDGYSQAAPLGLNPIVENYEVMWKGLTQAEFTTIINAVKSIGTWGVFLWTPPDSAVQKKFKIPPGKTFKRTRSRNGTYEVSVSLKQCFDIVS